MKTPFKYCLMAVGVLVSIVIILTACESNNGHEQDNSPKLRSLSAEETEVVHAGNNFSLNIFSRINADHQENNLFISPFSISTALSMTLNGASGETLDAMKEALELEHLNEEEINEAYRDLAEFLLNLDKKVDLRVANSNWYREDLHIRSAFQDALFQYYDAEVNSAAFSAPSTKDLMNGWIENKTEGKIKNMIDAIPPDAVMYLINAIYFKAEWKYRFEKNGTEERAFHLSDGTQVNVPTMHSKGTLINYSQIEGMRFIDIPYGNGQFSFSILVPNDYTTDINDVIENLSAEKISSLTEGAISYTAELYLPKLKIEFKEVLNDVLTQMGMGIAFTDNADFSNLFQEELNLAISRVIHQSFLEVNEEGSEAAAATVVEITFTSAGAQGPAVLRIDRPFAFFIRENHSNTILFAGKVTNPL